MQTVQVLRPGETRTRFHRKPNFPIAGTMKPYGLYPLMIHPVLPGETLKSATTRWQVASMPLKNPLSGAWLESWFMYVKLTDIDRDLADMFISDGVSSTAWERSGATSQALFTANGQIDWVLLCLDKIMKSFFLDEGESARYYDGSDWMPRVKLNVASWYQNLMFEPAETALDTTGPRDAHEQLTAWQMLQQMQLTEISYEKYLEQYGVRSMRTGEGEPEIIRYSRSWTQPTVHVEPSTGSPASQWVWRDEVKAEKDKRFSEPGFLVQLAAVRPKVYQKNVLHSMVGNLWGFSDWYPAYNLTDPTAGVKNISSDDVVFDATWNAAEGAAQLLYDHRDLLSHGEQFINDRTNMKWAHPFSSGMSGLAADPSQLMRGQYATESDVESWFANSASEADSRCQYDGMTSLVIAGHVTDTTR